MDISRLRTLRELSSRHTMAAVAEALHLTPSAVSQQIALLEDEAGVQLVEKEGRGVRLTPAGEQLVAHAEQVFTALDRARSDMAALRKEISGTLRVAAFPTAGSSLLPPVINEVQRRYPYLRIVLDEMEPAEGLAALGSRRCDLAFVDDLTIDRPAGQQNIEKIALIDDALCVLLPSEHPLAGKKLLSVADLKDEQWALDSARSGFAEYLLDLCRQAGYEPKVNAHCRGHEILAAMVASGCSVAIVAGLRMRHPMPGVTVLKLRPEIKRKISVAYRIGERDHPAMRVFLKELEHSVRQKLLQ